MTAAVPLAADIVAGSAVTALPPLQTLLQLLLLRAAVAAVASG